MNQYTHIKSMEQIYFHCNDCFSANIHDHGKWVFLCGPQLRYITNNIDLEKAMNLNYYVEVLFNMNCSNCNHISNYEGSKYSCQKLGSFHDIVGHRIHNLEFYRTYGNFLLDSGRIYNGSSEITKEDFTNKIKEGSLIRFEMNDQTTKEFISEITNMLLDNSYCLKNINHSLYYSDYLVEKTSIGY